MNKQMNKQIRFIGLGIACMTFLCSCSHNEETEESNRPVELAVNTSIALTRAIETGTTFANGQSIAVYANSITTNATTNNYALYTYASSGSKWSASGSDKIYLSAEPATIYAHYPAYSGMSTPLKVNDLATSGVTASSTVNVATFEGTSASADDNNKITLTGSSNTADINAAPGETDYMYATKSSSTEQPQASNGKSTGSNSSLTKSVDLQMNHALSMVSFRIYKDENYHNTGKLTKIELKNAGSNTPLSKANAGHNTTMKISDGTIAIPSDNQEGAVYTRYLYNDSNAGYTIQKAPGNSDPENSPAFSILVFPIASIPANAIKVTFTIDGTPYEISIPSSGSAQWEAGNNNIYKVTMNSIGLEIGTVTIKEWSKQPTVDGGNLVNTTNI